MNHGNGFFVGAFIAVMVLGVILNLALDNAIIALALSVLILGGAAFLIAGFAGKLGKAVQKWLIIIVVSAGGLTAVIFIVIGIINASYPAITAEDMKMIIYEQNKEEIEGLQADLEDDDLVLELEISNYHFEKRTISKRGSISFSVVERISSKKFADLDGGTYDKDVYDKYCYLKNLNYSSVEIEEYYIDIEFKERRFEDSDGDIYIFKDNKIKKNDEVAYEPPSSSGSSASSSSSSGYYKSKCPACNGAGYTRWYAGLYDEGWVDKCPMCNGSGVA